jgi:riboflavin synthase
LRLPLTLRQSFTTEPFVFTGLVETTGKLVRRTPGPGRDARLVVSGALGGEPLALGESIAVDGVCLTVAAIVDARTFEADASSETLAKTTLGALATGHAVNLERALAVGQRMGGHIVTGHVDGVGKIVAKEPVGGALKVTFAAPRELAKFIAVKGSICVCGVSLTVNGVSGEQFDVMLIPHTREKTSLDGLGVGAPVNLEVDIVARYVLRFIETTKEPKASNDAALMDRLQQAGFVK